MTTRLPLVLAAALLFAATPSIPASTPPSGGPSFAPIASPATGGSAQPNLAVGPDGRIWLSWLEQLTGGARALRVARLEGNQWGSPLDVVSGDSLLGISVDVPAVLPMGGVQLAALYLWKSAKGGHARDVRLIQTRDAGATWLPPVVANRDGTPTEHGFACLALDPQGARAIWLDGRKSAVTGADGKMNVLEEGIADMAMRTAVLTGENKLVDESEIDGRTCDCCPTAAAATPAGAIVAYRDRSAAEIRDIAVTRLDGKAWSAPEPVHADGWKIMGCPVNGPAVSVTGDHVAVAWYTAAHDSARVYAAFSDDRGAHFGPPARVDLGDPVGRVAVTSLADGGALVAWLESGGKQVRLLARRIGPDRMAGPASTVATLPAGRGVGIPHLARSGAAIVLTWTENGELSRVRTAIARAESTPSR